MTFFTSDGCMYEGMDEETIIRLRAELGKETIFCTKEMFNQYRESNTPKLAPLLPSKSIEERLAALEAKVFGTPTK